MELNQPNRKKTWIVLIIMVLIAVSLTAWILTRGLDMQPTLSPTSTTLVASDDIIDGEIPVGDYQATLAALQEKVDASRFEVKCNSSISRDPLTGMYNLLIGNTARNRYNCYVELVSKADGSILYRSPVLQPGQYLPSASIDGDIPGTVDASANFIVLNPENNTYMGKVVVAVTIHNQMEAGQ